MEIRQLPMKIGPEWISPIDNVKLIDSIKIRACAEISLTCFLCDTRNICCTIKYSKLAVRYTVWII